MATLYDRLAAVKAAQYGANAPGYRPPGTPAARPRGVTASDIFFSAADLYASSTSSSDLGTGVQTPHFNNYQEFMAWIQAGGQKQHTTSEVNYNIRPAMDAADDKAASLIDGYTHDSFQMQPKDAPEGYSPIYQWNDQYYRKVAQEEAVEGFRELPRWQQLAWARAAEVLGGGSRTRESTYAHYVSMSGDLSARGINRDPIELLMEDVASGYMPNVFKDGSDDDSSGGGGYGGGGFGGGGSTTSLMNEEDARAVVNALSSQMLGRTVSDKEFKRYYETILDLQRSNPQKVVETGDGAEVTDPIGMDGLRYNLEEDMRGTKDYVTNAISTQAIGLLEQYIQSRRV